MRDDVRDFTGSKIREMPLHGSDLIKKAQRV